MRLRVERRRTLICDACHHTEEVERLHAGLIDLPCEVCGVSLLTESEYRRARRAERILWFKTLIAKIRAPIPGQTPSAHSIHVKDDAS